MFAWFRWRGWFDGAEPDEARLAKARALQERFDREPLSFSDEEIDARATPGWVRQEVAANAGWKRALQTKPRTWLRARPGTAGEVAGKLNDCRLHERVPDAIEYLGADSLLTCRVGGQTLAVRVAGRVGLSQGDATRLSWARGAQHFFDGKSGRRSQEETNHDSATMLA